MAALIGQDELCKLAGTDRPGVIRRALEKQGIRPINLRPGFWVVTVDQLNAAGGLSIAHNEEEEAFQI